MPRLSCTVTVAATGLASENVTVAASGLPVAIGVDARRFDGDRARRWQGATGGALPSRPPVAGQRAVAGRVLRLDVQLAATPGATGAPAAERPSQLQATLEPVPDLLVIARRAVSSTRTVH